MILYPGRPICQLILMDVNDGGPKPEKLSGTYFAPVYPEAPIFPDPREELRRIGIPPNDFELPGHNNQTRKLV